jgi:hypothetical protein
VCKTADWSWGLLVAVRFLRARFAVHPTPPPSAGFYPLTVTEFAACVPASACTGVDSTAVAAQYRQLLNSSSVSSVAYDQLSRLLGTFLDPTPSNSSVSVEASQFPVPSTPISGGFSKYSVLTVHVPFLPATPG